MIQDRLEGRLVIDPERERERYEAHKPERIERARQIVFDDEGETIALEALDDTQRDPAAVLGNDSVENPDD